MEQEMKAIWINDCQSPRVVSSYTKPRTDFIQMIIVKNCLDTSEVQQLLNLNYVGRRISKPSPLPIACGRKWKNKVSRNRSPIWSIPQNTGKEQRCRRSELPWNLPTSNYTRSQGLLRAPSKQNKEKLRDVWNERCHTYMSRECAASRSTSQMSWGPSSCRTQPLHQGQEWIHQIKLGLRPNFHRISIAALGENLSFQNPRN